MKFRARLAGMSGIALAAALMLGACTSSGATSSDTPTPGSHSTSPSTTVTSTSPTVKSSPTTVPTSAFAGTWKGTFQSARRTTSHGTLTATFSQQGSTLGGSMIIAAACAPRGTITGTVRGKTVAFGVIHSAATAISFTGAVHAGKLTGSYHTGAACAYDRGTWSATKR